MLDEIKTALRISLTTTAFDGEITDLIEAAKSDLVLSGVIPAKANDATDPLIRRAVVVYCKANFGWDNPDAERLQKSYDLLKIHLTLSTDYAYCAVTFKVTDAGTSAPIRMAKVTFNGEIKTTDANGQAVFYVRAGSNYEYTVTADGYESDDDDDNLVDVSDSVDVDIALIAR